jgi:predicted MFS family arabinose efflux permease
MESGLVLLQLAVPLLAVRFGADWVKLGAIGWIAQAIRTPVCLTSGHLSERFGRVRIILPSAIVCALMMVGLAQVRTLAQELVLYTIALASIGAFYPPLQALIGDASKQGQLRKNLGMFNVGWCVGGAITAALAGLLVGRSLSLLLYVGAAFCAAAAVLVLTWRARPVAHANTPDLALLEAGIDGGGEDFGPLLWIARMGHFVGFVAFSVIRILFPKMGVQSFGWSEATVATIIAVFLWGLGIGILLTNVSPWWRGKLWPQIASQCVMLVCALGTALVCSPVLSAVRSPGMIGALLFGFGVAQSVAYTGALYYGLSSRKGKGANTGIHEALVAAGCVTGCLLGGIVAQEFGLVAPFAMIGGLATLSVIATGVIWARQSAARAAS